jgi:hypothetical protein
VTYTNRSLECKNNNASSTMDDRYVRKLENLEEEKTANSNKNRLKYPFYHRAPKATSMQNIKSTNYIEDHEVMADTGSTENVANSIK